MNKFLEKNLQLLFLGMYIFMITVFPRANGLGLILFIFVPSFVNIKRNGYKKTGFELPIILFLSAVIFSFIGTPLEHIKTGLNELEKPLKFLSLAIFIPQMFLNKKDIDEKKISYLFLGIVSLYSVLVYFG
ncbi:MAG: hypothetical protein ACRC0V_09530, partial [Fusobacteriaceae bacterium]